MSIFLYKDLDWVLISKLETSDIYNLYQVNRYYFNLLNNEYWKKRLLKENPEYEEKIQKIDNISCRENWRLCYRKLDCYRNAKTTKSKLMLSSYIKYNSFNLYVILDGNIDLAIFRECFECDDLEFFQKIYLYHKNRMYDAFIHYLILYCIESSSYKILHYIIENKISLNIRHISIIIRRDMHEIIPHYLEKYDMNENLLMEILYNLSEREILIPAKEELYNLSEREILIPTDYNKSLKLIFDKFSHDKILKIKNQILSDSRNIKYSLEIIKLITRYTSIFTINSF
jgi:hypothetical protein